MWHQLLLAAGLFLSQPETKSRFIPLDQIQTTGPQEGLERLPAPKQPGVKYQPPRLGVPLIHISKVSSERNVGSVYTGVPDNCSTCVESRSPECL